MKQKTITPIWLVLLTAILLVGLAACVRPVPQPDAPEATTPAEAPTDAPQIEAPTPMPPAETAVPYPGPDEPAVEPTTAPVVEGEGGEGGETQPAATPVVDPTGPQSHTVQPGETLYSISRQYNVSPEEIAAANNLANVNQLDVGQVLVIPVPGSVTPGGPSPSPGEQVHVVQAGENLFRIALSYGLTTEQLASYNGIANPERIYVGQVIRIPPR